MHTTPCKQIVVDFRYGDQEEADTLDLNWFRPWDQWGGGTDQTTVSPLDVDQGSTDDHTHDAMPAALPPSCHRALPCLPRCLPCTCLPCLLPSCCRLMPSCLVCRHAFAARAAAPALRCARLTHIRACTPALFAAAALPPCLPCLAAHTFPPFACLPCLPPYPSGINNDNERKERRITLADEYGGGISSTFHRIKSGLIVFMDVLPSLFYRWMEI